MLSQTPSDVKKERRKNGCVEKGGFGWSANSNSTLPPCNTWLHRSLRGPHPPSKEKKANSKDVPTYKISPQTTKKNTNNPSGVTGLPTKAKGSKPLVRHTFPKLLWPCTPWPEPYWVRTTQVLLARQPPTIPHMADTIKYDPSKTYFQPSNLFRPPPDVLHRDPQPLITIEPTLTSGWY